MGGHWGSWWPIFVTDFYGAQCSQHPFDPYSLTHVHHGLIFYVLLVAIPQAVYYAVVGAIFPWWWVYLVAFILALVLEILWEVLENSEFVLKRFREASGTSGDYNGDSIQNILGDIVSASSGYWMCVGCGALGIAWFPAVFFVVAELTLAFFIRDGLVLILIQLIFKSDKIKAWQKDLVEQKKREKSLEYNRGQ